MHSSQAEITTESPSPPTQVESLPGARAGGDEPLPGRVRILAAVGTALALGLVLLVGFRNKTASLRNIPGPANVPADLTQNLRLKGTTEAVLSRAILAPALAGQQMSTLTITKLAPSGSHLKRGDLLVEFDRQAQIRDFIDKQADYSKLVNQVVEEQAKENAARAKDETELKQAENNLSKTDLEMQKVEVDSRIDAEKAQQNADEAKATVAQLRETFDLKRKAAAAAVRILEIQRDRTRETMLHAQANAALMLIHSPIDGVVVLSTVWKQGKMGEVQEGDQVRPGVPFMQVIDPSRMQVRVLANQQDFLDLQIGQPSKVHLDAYPELEFPGNLEEVAPIGRNGDFSSRLRTFSVVFSIVGNDARLMPDLSAAVDVDVQHPGARDGAR